MKLEVSYEASGGLLCLYLQLSNEEVHKTVELAHGVQVDLDARGDVVGIEVLIPQAERLPEE